jgi:hypothetical protein
MFSSSSVLATTSSTTSAKLPFFTRKQSSSTTAAAATGAVAHPAPPPTTTTTKTTALYHDSDNDSAPPEGSVSSPSNESATYRFDIKRRPHIAVMKQQSSTQHPSASNFAIHQQTTRPSPVFSTPQLPPPITTQHVSFTTLTPRKPRILLPPSSTAAITTTSMFPHPYATASALSAISSPITRKFPVVNNAPKASASAATTVAQSKLWSSSNRLSPTASPPRKFVKASPSHPQPRAAVQHTMKPSTTTNHQPPTTTKEFDVFEFLED